MVCPAHITCLGGQHGGEMVIRGEAHRWMQSPRPADIELTNSDGETLFVRNITNLYSSWISSFQMYADGTTTIHFGGELHIGANQPPGAYTGTYLFSVDYQ